MIIVDTNMLMELEKIDIFEQLKGFAEFGEPVILSSSLNELENIGNKKSRFAFQAVKRISDFNPRIKILKTYEKSVDKAILKYARHGKDLVATNDEKLIKALKSNNVKVIRLRQKKYLAYA